MWISIIGPDGSGKSFISSILRDQKFKLLGDGSKKTQKYYFDVDKEASYLSLDHDVYTIGSMWDFSECKVPFYHQIFQTSDLEFEQMRQFYVETKELISPPTCVIYAKINAQMARDRLQLTGDAGDQLIHNIQLQINLYEDFISRVAVPVIEIDMERNMVLDDVLFGIDSIRSTQLDIGTIWRKDMMRNSMYDL